jgi:hypothetical protein
MASMTAETRNADDAAAATRAPPAPDLVICAHGAARLRDAILRSLEFAEPQSQRGPYNRTLEARAVIIACNTALTVLDAAQKAASKEPEPPAAA